MRASLPLHCFAVAALVLSLLSACTQPAEGVAEPYVLSGVEDYCYPFRAKVEDYGHQAIGTGYVGRDEQGRIFTSFFWRGSSSATDMGLHDVEDLRSERWQIEEDHGYLIFESRPGDSPMRLSSLIPIDFKPTEFGNENDMPQMVLISTMNNLALEPNGTEWRREFHSEDRDVVIIFGEGGPWSERPDDTFLFVEERDGGECYVNGIRLFEPYWRVHNRWTRESMEVEEDVPEVVQPRQPAKPQ